MRRLLLIALLPGLALAQSTPRNCTPGYNCTAKSFISSVASDAHAAEFPSASYLCMDGSTCSNSLRYDNAGSLIASGSVVVRLASNRTEVDTVLKVGGQTNNALTVTGRTTGTAVDMSTSGNDGLTITADGGITINPGAGPGLKIATDAYANNTNPIPAIHATNHSVATSLEYGTQALTTGAATVTFGTAFSAAPVCVCGDQANTAALVTRCNATTTVLTLAGTGSDTIGYHCFGNK